MTASESTPSTWTRCSPASHTDKRTPPPEIVSATASVWHSFERLRTRAETALAGVALGLAAGTKFTFLYAVPVLVAVALLALPRRRLAELCAAHPDRRLGIIEG